MKTVLIIDPPEGWKYGFPKPIPSEYLKSETLFRIWLQQQDYPCSLIDVALKHSRYWEATLEDE